MNNDNFVQIQCQNSSFTDSAEWPNLVATFKMIAQLEGDDFQLQEGVKVIKLPGISDVETLMACLHITDNDIITMAILADYLDASASWWKSFDDKCGGLIKTGKFCSCDMQICFLLTFIMFCSCSMCQYEPGRSCKNAEHRSVCSRAGMSSVTVINTRERLDRTW